MIMKEKTAEILALEVKVCDISDQITTSELNVILKSLDVIEHSISKKKQTQLHEFFSLIRNGSKSLKYYAVEETRKRFK